VLKHGLHEHRSCNYSPQHNSPNSCCTFLLAQPTHCDSMSRMASYAESSDHDHAVNQAAHLQRLHTQPLPPTSCSSLAPRSSKQPGLLQQWASGSCARSASPSATICCPMATVAAPAPLPLAPDCCCWSGVLPAAATSLLLPLPPLSTPCLRYRLAVRCRRALLAPPLLLLPLLLELAASASCKLCCRRPCSCSSCCLAAAHACSEPGAPGKSTAVSARPSPWTGSS
jgi:hypothetical protein